MKAKELIQALQDMNPDADVYAMEAITGEWQKIEDCEQEYSNVITLGCSRLEDDEELED